jgi:hypothetical protein
VVRVYYDATAWTKAHKKLQLLKAFGTTCAVYTILSCTSMDGTVCCVHHPQVYEYGRDRVLCKPSSGVRVRTGPRPRVNLLNYTISDYGTLVELLLAQK